MISSSSASNCAPCWRRARLLQALDLADDLVDVVAGARVHVHGVVAQRTHVVGIRALVHARELGRVDPQLARPADDLVVHVGDLLHARDGEAAGPREAGEEVELGVGLGVRELGEAVDRRPADEPLDPARRIRGNERLLRARCACCRAGGLISHPLAVGRAVASVQRDRVSVDRQLRCGSTDVPPCWSHATVLTRLPRPPRGRRSCSRSAGSVRHARLSGAVCRADAAYAAG